MNCERLVAWPACVFAARAILGSIQVRAALRVERSEREVRLEW